MDFMIISSESYLKYSNVLLRSIIENNSGHDIYFHIVGPSFSNELEKQHLSSNVDSKVLFYEVNYEQFDVLGPYPHVLKLLLPQLIPHLILPDDIDRVLYLELDTLVNGNLEILFDIDLGDNIIAGSGLSKLTWSDQIFHSYVDDLYKSPVDRHCTKEFVNAGVILFNLKQMRMEKIDVTYYLDYLDKTQEQMINNAFVKTHRVVFISPIYNLRPVVDVVFPEFKNVALIDMDKVKIIHYAKFQFDGLLFFVKPWELLCEDHNLNYVVPLEYNPLDLNLRIHSLMKLWWDYASKCSNYADLYNYMVQIRSVHNISYHNIYPNYADGICRVIRGYLHGIHVKKDLDRAMSIIKKLPDDKKPVSEYMDLLLEIGTTESLNEMVSIGRKYAESGNIFAAARLARAYRFGKGIECDLVEASNWMRVAADRHLNWAEIDLLDILYDINTEESLEEYYNRSLAMSKSGNKSAMLRLSNAYLLGKGTEINEDLANYWKRESEL